MVLSRISRMKRALCWRCTALYVNVSSRKESTNLASAKKMPNQTQIPKGANFLLGGLAG